MSAGHFGQAGPVMSAGHFTSSWTTFWTGWTRYECWTLYQQLDYILEGLDTFLMFDGQHMAETVHRFKRLLDRFITFTSP